MFEIGMKVRILPKAFHYQIMDFGKIGTITRLYTLKCHDNTVLDVAHVNIGSHVWVCPFDCIEEVL